MEHKHIEKETAKELTLQVLQTSSGAVFDRTLSGDPEKIGEAIAKLYNTILNNLDE